jgi:hypothetical protein
VSSRFVEKVTVLEHAICCHFRWIAGEVAFVEKQQHLVADGPGLMISAGSAGRR